ncbi:hypothetical protein GGI35DRAFT_96971 [Trichoderma velutinum]
MPRLATYLLPESAVLVSSVHSASQPQLRAYGLLLDFTFTCHRCTVEEGPENRCSSPRHSAGILERGVNASIGQTAIVAAQKGCLSVPTLRSTTAALASRWRMHAIRDLCQYVFAWPVLEWPWKARPSPGITQSHPCFLQRFGSGQTGLASLRLSLLLQGIGRDEIQPATLRTKVDIGIDSTKFVCY